MKLLCIDWRNKDVWNLEQYKKEFQFGIRELTKQRAKNKLFQKIGYDSYKWRFEIRRIPEEK